MSKKNFKLLLISLILSQSNVNTMDNDVVYAEVGQNYEGHWALNSHNLDDANVIFLAKFLNKYQFVGYLNPTDKRGYRAIVRYINNENMASTLNRTYTFEEEKGLSIAILLLKIAFKKTGFHIVQTAVAGNNSQEFNSETGVITIGTKKEPSFLHGHLIVRGNPKKRYFGDVPLAGPEPGKLFNMRGDATDPKRTWEKEQMTTVVDRLREQVETLKDDFTKEQMAIITQTKN